MARKEPPAAALATRRAPRQQRSEHTVAILVEAAAQVLETAGLEGYNTNAVAKRAGISIGSLYQYFSGKDALTIALMRRESGLFLEDGTQALTSANGRQALERYIDAAVRQQLARPRLARLLDIEESRAEMQEALKASGDFRRLLAKVLKAGDLPAQPRPRIAAADVAAIIRGLTDGAGERGETHVADLRRRIVAAVFGYLERMNDGPGENASKPQRKSARPS